VQNYGWLNKMIKYKNKYRIYVSDFNIPMVFRIMVFEDACSISMEYFENLL